MRKTQKKYAPSTPAFELCWQCKGEGKNSTRGYQQSSDEAHSVTCGTCRGAGELERGSRLRTELQHALNHLKFARAELKSLEDSISFWEKKVANLQDKLHQETGELAEAAE